MTALKCLRRSYRRGRIPIEETHSQCCATVSWPGSLPQPIYLVFDEYSSRFLGMSVCGGGEAGPIHKGSPRCIDQSLGLKAESVDMANARLVHNTGLELVVAVYGKPCPVPAFHLRTLTLGAAQMLA